MGTEGDPLDTRAVAVLAVVVAVDGIYVVSAVAVGRNGGSFSSLCWSSGYSLLETKYPLLLLLLPPPSPLHRRECRRCWDVLRGS